MPPRSQKTAAIVIERLAPSLGARVTGIDLATPLDGPAFQTLHDAFVAHEVLVFPDQDITAQQFLDFGRMFGTPSVHPFSPSAEEAPELIVLDNDGDHRPLPTDVWHSDETFRLTPPMATLLRATIVPPLGGDTMFASMTAAFEGLSPALQNFIMPLTARHEFGPFADLFPKTAEGRIALTRMEEKYPAPFHPIVRVHPVSGKKALFVNAHFCTHIEGLHPDESRTLLDFLYRQAMKAEYQLRVSWRPKTLVMWDNRSVVHCAVHDYFPHRRRMERVTITGARPTGPGAGAAQDTPPADEKVKLDRTGARPVRTFLVGVDDEGAER